MSFATTREYLQDDQVKCEAGASMPSRLFAAQNPGASLETMRDVAGQPYTQLATAFKFRTSYDAACRSRTPESPRVVDVSPEKKEALAQPVTSEASVATEQRAPEAETPKAQVAAIVPNPPPRSVKTVPPDDEVDARVLRKAARAALPRPMGLGARSSDLDTWRDVGSKKFNGADWRLSAYQHN